MGHAKTMMSFFLVLLICGLGGCEQDHRVSGSDDDDGSDADSDSDSDGDADSDGDGDSDSDSDADSDSDSDADSDSDSDSDVDSDSDSDSDTDGASFGSGSFFSSVDDFFDYLNDGREGYVSHSRWQGFPFDLTNGYTHYNMTWPLTFTWSDSLAAEAQAEADDVASGGTPSGSPTPSELFVEPIYISGVNTTHYIVGGRELAGNFSTSNCTLCTSHGMMRLAFYYQDPDSIGPVLTEIGVGASDMGDGNTWWTIVME
jgi:hypothetical protein